MKKFTFLSIAVIVAVLCATLIFNACEKNVSEQTSNSMEKNAEKKPVSAIDHQKYEEVGKMLKEYFDVIKNDKDFYSIVTKEGLYKVFKKNFNLTDVDIKNLETNPYLNDIIGYAEYMLKIGKMTKKEYEFFMFIDKCGKNYDNYLSDECLKDAVIKEVKNYIENVCKDEKVTEKELACILIGCYNFIYCIDYWFNESQDKTSKWMKLKSSNQSKGLLNCFLAMAQAYVRTYDDCMRTGKDGYDIRVGDWEERDRECARRGVFAAAGAWMRC